MPQRGPCLLRFMTKLVVDILPAALASVIGGFLFTQHYWGQWDHPAASSPAVEQHTAASAEMMKMVRDEHALIVNYLNAQLATQQAKFAAEDRASARARAAAMMLAHHYPTPARAARSRTARERAATGLASTRRPAAPIVIAQVEPQRADESIAAASTNGESMDSDDVSAEGIGMKRSGWAASAAPAQAGPPASGGTSFFAGALRVKDHVVEGTIRVKDRVVSATERAAFAIGGIPNWVAAVGDRIGGDAPPTSSAGSREISASW